MSSSQNIYAIIMAGGVGSRFWPVSRNLLPKQFHDFLGTGKTLLRSTFDRLKNLFPIENIFIVTNTLYADLVSEQIPELPQINILEEPMGRNTAPCIAYGLFRIMKLDPNAKILVAPSDHLIKDQNKYLKILEKSFEYLDETDMILTIGVKPTRADTGFGYIQYLKEDHNQGYHKVKLFTEKPDKEIAKSFVKSGDFVWNSGMFIFKAQTMKKAFQEYLPDMHEQFTEIHEKLATPEESDTISSIYPYCKNISIDYGILEKAENVYVIPANFGWNDLGNWSALYLQMEKDYLKNANHGNIRIYDAKNNIVHSENSEKLIVIKSASNLIVVDTKDVLLICPKTQEQEVKEIVNDLKKDKAKNERYL